MLHHSFDGELLKFSLQGQGITIKAILAQEGHNEMLQKMQKIPSQTGVEIFFVDFSATFSDP